MDIPRRRLNDAGPGWVEHYRPGSHPPIVDGVSPYATGTMRLPIVIKCAVDECPWSLSFPHGTPPNAQAIRLEVARWTSVEDGWVCSSDHAYPRRRPHVAPWWARLCIAVGVYFVLLSLMVWPVWLISGWGPNAVVNAVMVSVVWWGLVAMRAALRSRR